MYLLFLFRN